MGNSGCQLALKNTRTHTYSRPLIYSAVLPAWQQLLLDNEDLVHFQILSTPFSLALSHSCLLLLFIYIFFSVFLSVSGTSSLPLASFSYFTAFTCLSNCFLFFLFPFVPLSFLPAEPEEKQKEILNNTIPEGKDSGDLLVFTLLSVQSAILSCHCWCIISVHVRRWMDCYYMCLHWIVSGL